MCSTWSLWCDSGQDEDEKPSEHKDLIICQRPCPYNHAPEAESLDRTREMAVKKTALDHENAKLQIQREEVAAGIKAIVKGSHNWKPRTDALTKEAYECVAQIKKNKEERMALEEKQMAELALF